MTAYHARGLAFVLAAFLGLSLPSIAQHRAQLPGIDVLEEVPGIDVLEEATDEIDNQQDLKETVNSFEKGLIELENGIIKLGLNRPVIPHKKDQESHQKDRKSQREVVEKAAETLHVCKNSCEKPKEMGSKSEHDRFNTLREALQEIDIGQCKIICLEDLLTTVARIEDFPSEFPDLSDNDAALEVQKQQAVQAVLQQDWEKVRLVAREGVIGFQRVGLEELIRVTLEEYEEYGVPEGVTRITTGERNLLECSTETLVQTGDCIENVLQENPVPETLNPLAHLANSFVVTIRAYTCEALGVARQFGCGKEAVERAIQGN